MKFWMFLILEYLLFGWIVWRLLTPDKRKSGEIIIRYKTNLRTHLVIRWFCKAQVIDLIFIVTLFFTVRSLFGTIQIIPVLTPGAAGIFAVTLSVLYCAFIKIDSPEKFAWTWIGGFIYILFLLKVTIRSETGGIALHEIVPVALVISLMTALFFLIGRAIDSARLHKANIEIVHSLFMKDAVDGLTDEEYLLRSELNLKLHEEYKEKYEEDEYDGEYEEEWT